MEPLKKKQPKQAEDTKPNLIFTIQLPEEKTKEPTLLNEMQLEQLKADKPDQNVVVDSLKSSFMMINTAIAHMFQQLQREGTVDQLNMFSAAMEPVIASASHCVNKINNGEELTDEFIERMQYFVTFVPMLITVTCSELPDGFKRQKRKKAKGFADL
jgi:hypothetical protein